MSEERGGRVIWGEICAEETDGILGGDLGDGKRLVKLVVGKEGRGSVGGSRSVECNADVVKFGGVAKDVEDVTGEALKGEGALRTRKRGTVEVGVIDKFIGKLRSEESRRITIVVAVDLVGMEMEEVEVDVVNYRVVGGSIGVALGGTTSCRRGESGKGVEKEMGGLGKDFIMVI